MAFGLRRAAHARLLGALADQEQRLVALMKEVEPTLNDAQHGQVTKLLCELTAYNVMQTLLDPLWGKGIHAYFKGTNLSRLDDALIEKLVERHLAAPGPQAEIHIHQMGGANESAASRFGLSRAERRKREQAD